jgi:hypothetical protein
MTFHSQKFFKLPVLYNKTILGSNTGVLNSGLPTLGAGPLPLEPHLQPTKSKGDISRNKIFQLQKNPS